MGALGVGAYPFAPPTVTGGLFVVLVLASIGATVAGTVRNGVPGRRGPWWALVAAESVFFTAAVLRLVLPSSRPSVPSVADLVVIPGYVLTGYALVHMLHRRRAALRALHALGITLCIDDFGTGYSSLSYLRQFPAGIVKIDRSFVSGLGEDGDDDAIVRTVIAMAHALGREVVAEGVETVVQRDRLRDLGCDLAQGFLWGAPRPAGAQDPTADHAPPRTGRLTAG